MSLNIASGFAGPLLLFLSACSTVPSGGGISDAISSASTAADHQRIADHFAKMAKGYEAEALQHEQMARSYMRWPKGEPEAWAAHCKSLQKKFGEAAQEARALEQAHRQLAGSSDCSRGGYVTSREDGGFAPC